MGTEGFRKGLHIVAGLAPALFILAFGWTGGVAIAIFLLAYVALAWEAETQGLRLPIISASILHTRRPEDDTPRGAFEFILASVLVVLVFPLPYALGALALLGVGDGFAALVGRRWGRAKLPWNPSKSWAGLIAGILLGTPAFILFALIGAQLDVRGLAPVFTMRDAPTLFALAAMLLAFPTIHVAARILILKRVVERRSNATPGQVTARFFTALAPALTFAYVFPAFFDGPLLPLQGGHGPVGQLLLILVPTLAMVGESLSRRHDNLVVAFTGAGGAYLLLALVQGA